MRHREVVWSGVLPLLFAHALCIPAVAADGAPTPGAYCPLPEPGKPSSCLGPAQARYSDFFSGVDRGALDDAAAARVESDVLAHAADVAAYDALSTLAHGYYRLAKRASGSSTLDAQTQRRLERWNELLAEAYQRSENDPAYRSALRDAASDVHRRAPAVGLDCRDASGAAARCDSTEAVLRGMDDLRTRSGVRGQLTRLLGRWIGNAP